MYNLKSIFFFMNENFSFSTLLLYFFSSKHLVKIMFFYRLIESDAKSLNSLSGQNGQGSQSGHSRRNSDASQISVNSGTLTYLYIYKKVTMWLVILKITVSNPLNSLSYINSTLKKSL